MSSPDLAGKGAVITGGGSGISLAFTIHLYQAGCNVLICDLGLHREAQSWLESLPKTQDAIPRVAFNKTDVTDWKQLEQAFEVYAKEFGGVPHVLCPGAGIYEPVRRPLTFFSERNSVLILKFSPCPISGMTKTTTATRFFESTSNTP